jgi:hypothetical protein
MNNEAGSYQETTPSEQMDAATAAPQYDRGIKPAEVGARIEREDDKFKQIPTLETEDNSPTDDQTNNQSVDYTGGYTVDQEGLANNYAIEPEMYYETPGDMRQQQEEVAAARGKELDEVNEDSEGKLTMEKDSRGKGPGLV